MEVHILTSESPDLAAWLPKLLRLSREVFEPELTEAEYEVPSKAIQLQVETWEGKLKQPDAALFYISNDATTQSAILGFFFAYARARIEQLERNPQVTYHIYLAAVHPSTRGRGLFTHLLDAVKDHARTAGYTSLTVATIPDRFQRMYSILSKADSGWTLLEERTVSNSGGSTERKVLMEMSL